MKDRIINIIGVLMIFSLVMGGAYVFDSAFKSQMKYENEIKIREYIKFQKDSLELEILKKNIK